MLGHSFVEPDMVMPTKNAKTSPAQIIFHRFWPVRISGIHLLDEGTLELFGTVTSGSVKDDVAIASAVRSAAFTIAGMAVMLKEGATFTLADPATASEIFNIIQDHLLAWIRQIDGSFNRRSAPLEGLRELEALAEYLYPYAMRHRNAKQPESHLYRSLRDAISRRGTIRQGGAEEKEKQEELAIRPYKSITEEMSTELDRRERKWN